jgi:hypothetical protein
MRTLVLGLVLALAPPAWSEPQSAPVAGATVESIEMKVDRSVIFEPAADGKLHIIRVIDNDRTVQLPRIAGQVAVAMSYNREGGTILEFNNGLPYNFDYDLRFISPDGAATAPNFPVCTVGSERVGVEHWPQPYGRLVISGFRKAEKFSC